MKFDIRKATKSRAKLRMGFVGPAGSGKTYSALNVAQHLGERIGVIDTEHASSEKYAGEFEFDVITLDSFSPDTYVEAIAALEAHGCDVIVIDSLSHAWMGKDGALAQVDRAASKFRGNKFAAWGEVTPMHQALIEAILSCKCHLIATMRSKTEYVLDEKNKPQKVGMAPVQRDGMEYEFDVVGDLDHSHEYVITKSRCSELSGKSFRLPGKGIADVLKAWLTDGVDHDTKADELLTAMRAAEDAVVWAKANAKTVQSLPKKYRDRIGAECRALAKSQSQPGASTPPPSQDADAAQ